MPPMQQKDFDQQLHDLQKEITYPLEITWPPNGNEEGAEQVANLHTENHATEMNGLGITMSLTGNPVVHAPKLVSLLSLRPRDESGGKPASTEWTQ